MSDRPMEMQEKDEKKEFTRDNNHTELSQSKDSNTDCQTRADTSERQDVESQVSTKDLQPEHVEYGQEEQESKDVEANPTNDNDGPLYSVFTSRQKQFIVFMAAWAGFLSPLSANIYFPALNILSKDLNVSNSLINLTLTSYMIFQGLAPTLIGDLADGAGRRPACIIGLTIYIIACIGLALQDSFAALFVLRCLQSSGSSGMIALGMGVVADVSTSGERGKYSSWMTTGFLVPTAIGPILGGVLSQFLGWQAIFWFLAIFAATLLIPFAIAFPETGRNVVGNGSIPPQGWNMSLLNHIAAQKVSKERPTLERTISKQSARSARDALAKKRKLKFPNPLHTLRIVAEKDMGLLLFFNGLLFSSFYTLLASLPYLLSRIYGYNDLQVGLCYIPFGGGCLLAQFINSRLLDWNFRRVAKRAGITVDKKRGNSMKNFPIELARIPVAIPMVLIGCATIVSFGWVMEAETSIAAPLVLTFIAGLAIGGGFNVMNVLIVDNYPNSPATATAGNNLVRCLMGAGATAAIIYMIEAMGRGWCFTFIGAVMLLFSSILLVLLRWGPKWREERRIRMEERALR